MPNLVLSARSKGPFHISTALVYLLRTVRTDLIKRSNEKLCLFYGVAYTKIYTNFAVSIKTSNTHRLYSIICILIELFHYIQIYRPLIIFNQQYGAKLQKNLYIRYWYFIMTIDSFPLRKASIVSMNCFEIDLVSWSVDIKAFQWKYTFKLVPQPLVFGNQDMCSEWFVVTLQ